MVAFDAIFHFPGDEVATQDPTHDKLWDLAQKTERGQRPSRQGTGDGSSEKDQLLEERWQLTLIEKNMVDFSSNNRGKATSSVERRKNLLDVIHKLEMWGDLRKEMQLAQNENKVDMELHLMILGITFICRAAMVVGNFLVLQKGEGRKLQIVNFVVAYDLVIICGILLRCIQVCKDVNDRYAGHIRSLEILQTHVALEENVRARKVARNDKKIASIKEENAGLTGEQLKAKIAEAELENTPDDGSSEGDKFKYVQSFRDKLVAMESPMRLFGIVVNRNLLAALSTTSLTFLLPSVLPLMQMLVAKAHV
jgi:hypothetical protein